ncbi:antitoxin Phd_YefM of type II toxin-antitoxin system [Pseudomonas sp. WPR_5_2]|nr:antitoxin Phd_YefM of type II toxin-antitoxin system [Pseudomonas sp. WPR_5_2]
MAEERWSVAQAATHFDELLDQMIRTSKPIFIDGERRSAVLISIEEWNAIQDKVMPSVPSNL